MTTRNIVILSSNTSLKDALSEHELPAGEYQITSLKSNNAYHDFAAKNAIALLIIDCVEHIKASDADGAGHPVIFLFTALPEDRPLPAPASMHYVLKPVRLQMLLNMVTAILLEAPKDIPILLGGGVIFSPAGKCLSKPSSDVDLITYLTEKETALIKYLHDAGGREVTKSELLEHIWRYDKDADTHTIETHIYRLRQKIGGKNNGSDLIVTGPHGYRLAP